MSGSLGCPHPPAQVALEYYLTACLIKWRTDGAPRGQCLQSRKDQSRQASDSVGALTRSRNPLDNSHAIDIM
eukprot:198064-Amphidinium_carterae.1